MEFWKSSNPCEMYEETLEVYRNSWLETSWKLSEGFGGLVQVYWCDGGSWSPCGCWALVGLHVSDVVICLDFSFVQLPCIMEPHEFPSNLYEL